MKMLQYRCVFCTREFQDLEDVIQHNIDIHNNEKLRIGVLTLCDKTAKRKYKTKDYGIIPSSIKAEGKTIFVKDNKVIVEKTDASAAIQSTSFE
jgi:hypothetical protein